MFIKLTDKTDNRRIFFNTKQIIYIQQAMSGGTVIACNYIGLIYVKESPKKIITQIERVEKETEDENYPEGMVINGQDQYGRI